MLRLDGVNRGHRLACVALVAAGLLIAHGTATAATRKTPAPAQDATLMIGTPCSVSARACVDLTTQKAWLFKDNAIERGPVDITSGGPGKETPTGNFTVAWKDRNHVNPELTPMPYAVFFAAGGVAFHGGSLQKQSAGCVHLDLDEAIIFYDSLAIGAPVQVRGVAPQKKLNAGSNDGRSRSRDNRRGSDLPSDGPDITGPAGSGSTAGDDGLSPSTAAAPPASDDSSPPAADNLSTPARPQPAPRPRGGQPKPSSAPLPGNGLLGPARG
ncbi:MAG TPA: L,D-transpeptidase [Pseudonocardia sp.]